MFATLGGSPLLERASGGTNFTDNISGFMKLSSRLRRLSAQAQTPTKKLQFLLRSNYFALLITPILFLCPRRSGSCPIPPN